MTTRAKFRCLSITKTWDNKTSVDLKPVVPYTGDPELDKKAQAENKAFWTATPSGSCELCYLGAAPFVPGAYYYLDFNPSIPALVHTPSIGAFEWTLHTIEKTVHSLGVKLTLPFGVDRGGLQFGSIAMSIDNREAWKAFEEQMGNTNCHWSISFSPASLVEK